MNDNKYTRARDSAFALNRFVKPGSRPRLNERKAHCERDHQTARSLFHDPNILGYGVGPKMVEGARIPSEICLVFFVRKKLAKSRLHNSVTIPKRLLLETRGVRVVTDVQVWGKPPVSHGAIVSGSAVGDVAGNVGTITLAVRDSSTGDPLILSCSHVLAACGKGEVGDEVDSPPDASSDPGSKLVGRLLRFTEIDPRSLENAVDAAVAEIVKGVSLSNKIPGIGIPTGIRDLTLAGGAVIDQFQVRRAGAITPLAAGTIRHLHVSTRITYSQLNDQRVHFVDLVQYDVGAEEGDSGAAVIDSTEENNVVGMHIAGLPDGSASLFTHIRFVFDSMNVAL